MNSIEETPGVCGGEPCLAGTRIPMAHLQKLVEMGWSYEKILDAYPQLRSRLAEFYDAMGRWMNSSNWRLLQKDQVALELFGFSFYGG